MQPAVSASPDPAKPLVERKSLIGFRAACEQMWGQNGLQTICRALPDDVRERTAGLLPLPKWAEVGDLIAWHHAVWNGPAGRDEAIMTRHIHATVNQGFGRVKRFFLSLATPQSLAPRVAAIWRQEYSTGDLQATRLEERSSQLVLADHPFVTDPLMRFVIAEVFRYVLSLTRTQGITSAYGLRDGTLVVVLRWD